MYAVIKTGGKQYRVEENDIIRVEKLAGEAGDTVILDDLLAYHDGTNLKIGQPFVEGVTVNAEILKQTRNDKIIIFKKRRRQNSRRKNGHRQHVTLLRVTSIGAPQKAIKATKAVSDAETTKKVAPKKTAAKKTATKKATAAKADAKA